MRINKNPLEWTVFGISVLLIAGVAGVLVHASRLPEAPPELRVSTGPATRLPNGAYQVAVTVFNEGNETAEQARIEVVLWSGDREIERSGFTIAFVPRKSSRQGWVTFGRDPRCCTLVARAAGFERP